MCQNYVCPSISVNITSCAEYFNPFVNVRTLNVVHFTLMQDNAAVVAFADKEFEDIM